MRRKEKNYKDYQRDKNYYIKQQNMLKNLEEDNSDYLIYIYKNERENIAG